MIQPLILPSIQSDTRVIKMIMTTVIKRPISPSIHEPNAPKRIKLEPKEGANKRDVDDERHTPHDELITKTTIGALNKLLSRPTGKDKLVALAVSFLSAFTDPQTESLNRNAPRSFLPSRRAYPTHYPPSNPSVHKPPQPHAHSSNHPKVVPT
jgi:hypothetical protein